MRSRIQDLIKTMKQFNGLKLTLSFKRSSLRLFVTLLFLLLGMPMSSASVWQTIAPGIEYQTLSPPIATPWSHIHVFRIDLHQNKLDLINAKDFTQRYAVVNDFARKSHALMAINAGFFDHHYRPLGLRIRQHQVLNPLKSISWWGVFSIHKQQAQISAMQAFKPNQSVDFAVQSGPRLIVHGQIPKLKPGLAERTALGIDRKGHVIVLVTENAAISTTTLARILRSPPLKCDMAINLDGGSSTQLYAQWDGFKLHVPGFSPVSDAIIVRSLG